MTLFFLLNPKNSQRAGGYLPEDASPWWKKKSVEIVKELSDGPDPIVEQEVLQKVEQEVRTLERDRIDKVLSLSLYQTPKTDVYDEQIRVLKDRLGFIKNQRRKLAREALRAELEQIDRIRDAIIQAEIDRLVAIKQQEAEDEELFLALYDLYY